VKFFRQLSLVLGLTAAHASAQIKKQLVIGGKTKGQIAPRQFNKLSGTAVCVSQHGAVDEVDYLRARTDNGVDGMGCHLVEVLDPHGGHRGQVGANAVALQGKTMPLVEAHLDWPSAACST
jgi:hypothetical protein